MLKNQAAAAPAAQHTGLKNVRILATSALLAAISVVLARLIIPMPNETTRFSLEAVPIFIAGMLFGPIPGALVSAVNLSVWKDGVVFAILIVVLLVKPTGILGRPQVEKV